ncbi:adenylate cyclase [Aurantiacibacter sp. MUD11]|uniref:adenylate cyclase n=1 Tax=Aurantiacibacter sp. MUD11 TaxID=3003265 RepID=UPI0022AB30F0|nr:adenylate cyclase [Aurantiacibacter sp. MUD11]WAT19205.1 adenylate cyclase [Aurantiacibacter sp. MUD11]
MATSPAQIFVWENAFYRKVAIGIALLMLVGFGLFNLAGLTDVRQMPTSTHLHGVIMFSWLLLFVVQNFLGAGKNLSLHRKLGWFGAALAVVAVVTAWQTGIVTTSLDRAPPVFYPPYFLALNFIQPLFFAGFIAAAITMRKQTDWHRRLMLGAIIVVAEPPLGRLSIMLAVPLLGGPDNAIPLLSANQWMIPLIEMTAQLLIVGFIAWRDAKARGSVHPAIKCIALAVPAFYASLWLLAAVPPFAEYAFALKGSAL